MTARSLFLTKSPEALVQAGEAGEHRLSRALGPVDLVGLGVGAIIGAGLFSLTGVVAAEYAGPAVILSYVVASIGCIFAALCYSELASSVPVSGSAYSYSYATMGELVAWMVGWDLIVEHVFGASTVAVSWSRYLVQLLADFGLALPPQLTRSAFDHPLVGPDGQTITGLVNLPAMFIIVAVSLLLMRGISQSSRVNLVITAIKVAIIVTFIAVGAFYVDVKNYDNFIPQNTGTFGEFGWSGVFRGAAIVFFSYLGFNVISATAQEVKDPQRTMPIGILGSLLICTAIYVAFSAVLVGMVHYTEFRGDAAPVATAIAKTPFPLLGVLIKVGVLAGFTSVVMVSLLGQSRVTRAMSADGLLPRSFGAIHPRWQSPWRLHIAYMVLVAPVAGLVPISALSQLSSIGTLFAFLLVCAGVIVLRRTRPDLPRRFKVPLFPFVPIAGIAMCLAMMTALHLQTWVRFGAWMLVGLVIFFIYSRPKLARATLAEASRDGAAEAVR